MLAVLWADGGLVGPGFVHLILELLSACLETRAQCTLCDGMVRDCAPVHTTEGEELLNVQRDFVPLFCVPVDRMRGGGLSLSWKKVGLDTGNNFFSKEQLSSGTAAQGMGVTIPGVFQDHRDATLWAWWNGWQLDLLVLVASSNLNDSLML